MHRQFFTPSRGPVAVWEPPVDVVETESEIWVTVALPGVGATDVNVLLEGNTIIIAGRRSLPIEARTGTIHRLEIPNGRFERRISLPSSAWTIGRSELANGCLVLTLRPVG
jgi:HSP20 family molecular chaperone IbpA